jgi:hypothetical protein
VVAAPLADAALAKRIAADWLASVEAFYVASEHSDPEWPAMLATVVRGSPQESQVTGFIGAQVAAGIVGPSTWRIGKVQVMDMGAGEVAIVEGCSWDPGAHYAVGGAAAPVDLGGGAGYTAYDTTMNLVGGRWAVYSTTVEELDSNAGAGPCDGF